MDLDGADLGGIGWRVNLAEASINAGNGCFPVVRGGRR